MALAAILLAAASPGATAPQDRPMTTDRPDTTESPMTVAPGRIQIEASLAEYAFSREDGAAIHRLSVAPVNLKYGLTDDIDVQLLLTPYDREIRRDASGRSLAQGFGDTQVRVKFNLWGNDGGTSAFAVMPFVKLPTGDGGISNGHVEGGLILPLQFQLQGEAKLSTMVELDLTYDEDRNDYGIDLVHSASFGFPVAGKLEAYVEYIGVAPRDGGGGYRARASGGLTCEISDDWMIDVGGTLGLAGRVERVTAFVGTSFRF